MAADNRFGEQDVQYLGKNKPEQQVNCYFVEEKQDFCEYVNTELMCYAPLFGDGVDPFQVRFTACKDRDLDDLRDIVAVVMRDACLNLAI